MTWTSLDEYRAQARERYHHLTPYRLGWVIGEADGDPALCPYERWRTVQVFRQGYLQGRDYRQKKTQGVQDTSTG